MKSLLTLMALTLAVICDARSSSSLPYPWLSLDRSAKVLHLVCRPPPQALGPNSSWKYVDDLKLFAFLPQHNLISNVSLVSMISSWTEPKANPKFSISRASFKGTWSSKSVSLEYMLPVTNKELGRYACEVDYRDNDDQIQRFTTIATVDDTFVNGTAKTDTKVEHNFQVSVFDAHNVKVTWTKPEYSIFIQARVSRQRVGENRETTDPAIDMFITDSSSDYQYRPEVLLKKVNYQDGNNMSITLFVKRDKQEADYRYACWVPYPACRGENEVFCTCPQQVSNPDGQVRSSVGDYPETFDSKFKALLALLITAVILLVITVILLVVGILLLFKLYFRFHHSPNGGRNGGDSPNGGRNGGDSPNGGRNGGDSPDGGRNGGDSPDEDDNQSNANDSLMQGS